MKVKEIQTYQSIRLAGSRGQITFLSSAHGPTSDFEMELMQGMGVKVSYPYNTVSGVSEVDTMIIPFANIAYLKLASETKAKVEEPKMETSKIEVVKKAK